MKEKKDCKIVQDLLPNYIEKLTDEETNKYIEEHLEECPDCQNTLKDMKNDLKISVPKVDKKEINYMKKFKKQMKALKFIILAVIVLILIIYIIMTARKMIIMSDLSNKAKKYSNSTNYHATFYYYLKGKCTTIEEIKLGDKIKKIYTWTTEKEVSKIIYFGTKKIENEDASVVYNFNIYKEEENNKIACLNQEIIENGMPQKDLINTYELENWWNLFEMARDISIYEKTFYGKECYYIRFNKSGWEQGFDKETGLYINKMPIEEKNPDGTIERTEAVEVMYEFDNVRENDFIEPDISDYKITSDINEIY